MRIKKSATYILVTLIFVCCLCVNSFATNVIDDEFEFIVTRASGYFDFSIEPGMTIGSSTKLPLEEGEIVTIDASYTPSNAGIYFGLIAPDGVFYAIDGENGEFNESIKVPARGNYTFAVQNISPYTISVSGSINY